MKTIKKFPLEIEPTQTVVIPYNSKILSLGLWEGKPTLWVFIDSTLSAVPRVFHMIADDKEITQQLNETGYIGSFDLKAENEPIKLHVFEG